MPLDHDRTIEAVLDELRPHIAQQVEILRARGFSDDIIVVAYRELAGEGTQRDRPH